MVRDGDRRGKKGVIGGGDRKEEPVETGGAGVGGEGVRSDVKVSVRVMGGIHKVKAELESFPTLKKTRGRETGAGAGSVGKVLHKVKVPPNKGRH
jgi:hypothetical protein